jgi:hypothetical protein
MGKLAFSVFAFLLLSIAGQSQEVTAKGRRLFHSCGYFSSIEGEFEVRFKNLPVTHVQKAILHYGFGGEQADYFHNNQPPYMSRFIWDVSSIKEVEFIMEPSGEWVTQFSAGLAYRSSPKHYDRLQFVIALETPNGARRYYRGSQTSMGYYEADLTKVSRDCVPLRQDLPLEPLDILTVEKAD